MMDHEEWRNAYLRATQEDILTILRKEIEQLQKELIEAKSEIQRLQSIARY